VCKYFSPVLHNVSNILANPDPVIPRILVLKLFWEIVDFIFDGMTKKKLFYVRAPVFGSNPRPDSNPILSECYSWKAGSGFGSK
jgi:hypothetical protein